jgi:hydroxypyruvate isomerase
MDRRQFARSLAGAAVGAAALPAALVPSVSAADAKPALPFKLSVMLWTVYHDLPFEQRLEKIAEAGYGSVELVNEFNKWSDDDFRRFNAKKRSLGITFDAVTCPVKGIVDPSKREEFLADLKNFLPTAEKLEVPKLIILSGNRIDGVAHEVTHQACVDTLKYGADVAAKANVTLLVENIDPEENPKYFLTSVAEGFEIIRQVDHPHVRFLYDFFHEQISEGNLIEKLEKNIDLVGLVHIADVPGRHQPGTGEINYSNIFRKLADLKYNRYAAMEFIPTGDPVAALRGARELVEHSLNGYS